MGRLTESVEKTGVCKNKTFGFVTLFKRVKIFTSRQYRVWWFPGEEMSELVQPDDFLKRFEILEYY